MENIKIFSNFMKLKKFKNWSDNDLAKEVSIFYMMTKIGIYPAMKRKKR